MSNFIRKGPPKTYVFHSEGHCLVVSLYATQWRVTDGKNTIILPYELDPEPWVKYWQKLKDIAGVYTMLYNLPTL